MNRRLLSVVGLYGVVAPVLVVGGAYLALRFADRPFAPVGFATIMVGLVVGPLMFARAGTASTAVGGEGDKGGVELEHETTSFVKTGRDTPLQLRVGLFLLGAVGVAALLMAFG